MPEQQPNLRRGRTTVGALPGLLTVRVHENAALTEMAAGLVTMLPAPPPLCR